MIKIALKDLRLFLQDKRSLILSFALPIILITLFAFAFGGAGSSQDDDAKISLLISDLDQSETSKSALEILDTLSSIDLKPKSLAEAQKLIRSGNEGAVLVIHKGFSDSLNLGKKLPLELQYDQAQEIRIGLLQQSLIPTMAMLPFNLGNPKLMMQSRFDRMTGQADPVLKNYIHAQSDSLFDALSKGISSTQNPSDDAAEFFGGDIKMTGLIVAKEDTNLGLIQAVAGTAVMMLLFSVVSIGAGLLEEKEEGTLKRLLYTPVKPRQILFGKMISANIISIAQLLIMFIFAALAFGLDIYSHGLGMLIMIVATAFACSAFGVVLASFAKTRRQVQGLSTLLILVMSAIGGSMLPIMLMPKFMQKIATFSVNYWSIQGFYDIFWRNIPLLDPTFITRVAILLGIGLLLNAIAVVMFKRNILKMN